MTLEEERYISEDLDKTKEELLLVLLSLRRENDELKNYKVSNAEALLAMHKEFMRCKEELASLREENRNLKDALAAMTEKEKLRTKDIFGRATERLSDLLSAGPAIEEADESEAEVIDLAVFTSKAKEPSRRKKPHGKRSAARRAQRVNLDSLPQQSDFVFDAEGLDQKYGRGNWRIAFWKRKRTVEYPQTPVYCLNKYTPVISVGLEHQLVAEPNPCLLPGSFVSESLYAYCAYGRLFLSLPFYRLSDCFNNLGLPISRQTLTGWFIRFAQTHFSLVFDRLREELLGVPCHQCDETFMSVLRDGRRAGSRSYMWIHRTSELYPGHPIILFCFELTRGTDHLRKFYEDFAGYITCDAYCSYKTLESEKAEVVQVCGCMMHLRRRFAESLSLIDTQSLTDEMVEALTETKALRMIGQIYEEDERLKDNPPSERKRKRDENVRPLVEKFFHFVESIEVGSETSNRLKDAIGYARNQKKYLCRFLMDGTIPIDDGATERATRTFAISKRNSLFSTSIEGAEASAVMYSILETAKANKVNVYLYFRHLLEEITRHLEDTNTDFLKAMMPWSSEYIAYEARNQGQLALGNSIKGAPGEKPVFPKTQKKSAQVRLKVS